ncbi:MAG: DUF4124 domain-containing protein [Piscirickettsiaceae bacterium]|nr:DUF4124 domain-containing protein [Piscirickettsiaceae bacterium]
MTKLNIILITAVLSTLSLASNASPLYRFLDEDGVSTTSRSLPPSAAQKGYDILDDKSLRLIERILPALTVEQIAEEERQIAEKKEADRLAEIKAKEDKKQQEQQEIYNKNLLASYATKEDLIKKRDDALSHNKTQIEKSEALLEKGKQYSLTLQQQAAEQELAGQELSDNLKKRLKANNGNIKNNEDAIERLNLEAQQLTKQYAADLERLQQLLTR